jgi:acid phosphatase family membrane protein YuiD
MLDLHLLGIPRPLWVGVLSGAGAQALKLVSFLWLEKRINFRRLVETDGAPNMHAAAFAGLSAAIAQENGFGSIDFAVAACFTTLVTIDMWNVKRAASHQAEVVDLILVRLRPHHPIAERRPLSYNVLDVLTGTVLGMSVALLTR